MVKTGDFRAIFCRNRQNGRKKHPYSVRRLITYTIPSNVTKLDDHCFSYCFHLRDIRGLERVTEFGRDCFLCCYSFSIEDYPRLKEKKTFVYGHENNLLNPTEIKQLERWSNLKYGETIFDSNKHTWYRKNSEFNGKIIGKK